MTESLQLIYIMAHALTQQLQPILVPLCFVIAWATVGFGLWSLWAAMRDSVQRAKRMHQIPCSQCRYFSGNYLLKCPIHPQEALSEAAINCPDFESKSLDWQLRKTAEHNPH